MDISLIYILMIRLDVREFKHPLNQIVNVLITL